MQNSVGNARRVNDLAEDDTTTTSGGGDQEVLAFNLADPERLSSQLDEAHLDDAETEVLLNEALKLNAQLKETLRQQQLGEPSPNHSAGKVRGHGQGQGQGRGPRQPSHPLQEQFARRQPPAHAQVGGGKTRLPPIASSAEPARGGKPSKGGKHGGGSDVGGAAAPRSPPSRGRRQGSGKKKPVDNRPAWDDRFSFN